MSGNWRRGPGLYSGVVNLFSSLASSGMLGPCEWDYLEGLVYKNDPLVLAAYDLYVDRDFGEEDSLKEFCDTLSCILEKRLGYRNTPTEDGPHYLDTGSEPNVGDSPTDNSEDSEERQKEKSSLDATYCNAYAEALRSVDPLLDTESLRKYGRISMD